MKIFVFECAELDNLIAAIKRRRFKVIGPTVSDSAIIYAEIAGASDLPIGWTDEQANGSYRLKRRDDNAVFAWNAGPQSWKKFLFPPVQKIFITNKSTKGFDSQNLGEQTPGESRYAFFGVRSCELNAIAIQDKIFLEGPYIDPLYRQKRAGIFIVAVNCSQAGGTCFCDSMQTGPKAVSGFDIALTEILDDKRHCFVAETGTAAGEEILASIKCTKAADEDITEAKRITDRTRVQIHRKVDTADLKNVLYQNSEHPRWEHTAELCLTCANCTMVCPTCFCTTVEDVTDIGGKQAERIRKWDSCFMLDFSYIHGGSVRASVKSRYRQWVTHKFASWLDQFGTFGCVGCGRCITWCPVGIDITEEVKAIREKQT
ncbi:MAG: 4Fe-4S dicluster domain-containing protein [Bacteroidetes bacterium]|nr:4Fe-4S dicluster domain-containing protein [Bacteroidota bacterium]